MDHLTNIQEASLWAIPWFAFLTGLGGSLHCAGMCGGLTLAASSQSKSGIAFYQLGRLISYASLGLLSGQIGSYLKIESMPKPLFLILSSTLGLFFIYWGISIWRKKNLEITIPSFAKQKIDKGWKVFFRMENGASRSLGLGFFSIFLPCGFLYGAVVTVALLQNPLISAMAMMGFWLGTVPSLVIAPSLIQKFLSPLIKKIPRLTSIMLISFGLLTIVFRVVNFYGQSTGQTCH